MLVNNWTRCNFRMSALAFEGRRGGFVTGAIYGMFFTFLRLFFTFLRVLFTFVGVLFTFG